MKAAEENTKPGTVTDAAPSHFIRNIITDDLEEGKNNGRVHTRFPPEPNGYLHIGHAKSICLNFGLAAEFGGLCNLRFDDTNPSKEDVEYVDSIKADVRWLGFDWAEREFYASDYFDQLYDFAVGLMKAGNAYVCDLTRGSDQRIPRHFDEPGKNSPYRDRSVEENLDLLDACGAGNFRTGPHAAREDRHGFAESESPRPGHVPHSARHASQNGRQMVHLPDLRFRPRPVRFPRGNYPLPMHAGIRGSPAAL